MVGFWISVYLCACSYLANVILASPVTFELNKGLRECFYLLTPDIDCRVSYYFAVQAGESNDYDIDYEVFGPGQRESIIQRHKERQGEWTFNADHKGEYSICFYGGKAHDKIVDFEMKYECNNDERDIRNQRRKARKDQRQLRDDKDDKLQDSLENSIDLLEQKLYGLERSMQYYKTRNNRNHHTVSSTDKRIVMFSIYGILLVVGMSVAQIAVLQWFFTESRRQKV